MIPWRMQTGDKGDFDELVVGAAVHLEMMDDRTLWMGIYHPNGSDRWTFSVTMKKDGTPKQVTMVEQPIEPYDEMPGRQIAMESEV